MIIQHIRGFAAGVTGACVVFARRLGVPLRPFLVLAVEKAAP